VAREKGAENEGKAGEKERRKVRKFTLVKIPALKMQKPISSTNFSL